jgi:hypothetical protein
MMLSAGNGLKAHVLIEFDNLCYFIIAVQLFRRRVTKSSAFGKDVAVGKGEFVGLQQVGKE